MTPQQLRQRLRSGQKILGTLIVSPSPRWPDAVKSCGLDFVFIDTEHIAIDRHQLSWMCQTYTASGLSPIVRIPSPDPYAATMALDAGAAGVIAPYVESLQQVQILRGAIKLRPIKGRKLDQMLGGGEVEAELEKYLKSSAESRLFIVNIESVPALESLDEILSVPDLDGVLIGPHDLTCSLGIPEQYEHPKFLDACGKIFSKARNVGKGAGIHFWGSIDQQVQMLQLGANMLIHSGDISLFQKHLSLDIQTIRNRLGIAADATEEKSVIV